MKKIEATIQKAGGVTELAKLLGVTKGAVSKWAKVNRIPSKWHNEILEKTKMLNMGITAEDLVSGSRSFVIPIATHKGEIFFEKTKIPCYVLNDGRRVISLRGITGSIIGKDTGDLQKYLSTDYLKGHMPDRLIPDNERNIPAVIEFSMSAGSRSSNLAMAKGITAEDFMDMCRAYMASFHEIERSGEPLTPVQSRINKNIKAFYHVIAIIGLIATIDEVTGYQYARASDALRLKLDLYLQEEVRKWQKTFPDELWEELGRLTNWEGSVHNRPRYWGKLVMELIYGYMDNDVKEWLEKNTPSPQKGPRYHQWLSAGYGENKLAAHIWMVIGLAKTCDNLDELRSKLDKYIGGKLIVAEELTSEDN